MIDNMYLTFFLGDEEYALPVENIVEVSTLTTVRPIPMTSQYYKGIIKLRGNLVSIIDTRLLLNMEKNDTSDSSIICKIDDLWFGYLVDDIGEMITIDQNTITQQTIEGDTDRIKGIARIGKRVIIVLNINNLK